LRPRTALRLIGK